MTPPKKKTKCDRLSGKLFTAQFFCNSRKLTTLESSTLSAFRKLLQTIMPNGNCLWQRGGEEDRWRWKSALGHKMEEKEKIASHSYNLHSHALILSCHAPWAQSLPPLTAVTAKTKHICRFEIQGNITKKLEVTDKQHNPRLFLNSDSVFKSSLPSCWRGQKS